jgi:hypothetical protein
MAMNYALRPGTTQKVSPSGSSAATCKLHLVHKLNM